MNNSGFNKITTGDSPIIIEDSVIDTTQSPVTITFSRNDQEISFSVEDTDLKVLMKDIVVSQDYPKREEFLITAVKNLLRKINFSELYQQLTDETISEDEFQAEIDNNPNKYVIETIEELSPEDFQIITELVNKITFDIKEFSVNDIAELFSVEPEKLITISGYTTELEPND